MNIYRLSDNMTMFTKPELVVESARLSYHAVGTVEHNKANDEIVVTMRDGSKPIIHRIIQHRLLDRVEHL